VNVFLKKFLRVVATIAFVGGPVLSGLAILLGSLSVFLPRSNGMGLMLVFPALYLLFLSLLFGGVLHLLLSIDDRLERLEARN